MNEWIILVLALLGTILFLALIGFVVYLLARRFYSVARNKLEKARSVEALRIIELKKLARLASLPESLLSEIINLSVAAADDPEFSATRDKIDLLSKILTKYFRENDDRGNEIKALELYDQSSTVFDDYTKSATTYNALIRIVFAKPFVYFAHLKPLPIL